MNYKILLDTIETDALEKDVATELEEKDPELSKAHAILNSAESMPSG